MALDNAIITACIAAGSASFGAIIGSVVPWVRDALAGRKQRKNDAAYLAILVIAHLDKFVRECALVAQDYGTEDDRGLSQATTSLPNFAPLELDVNWKSLPSSLMFKILDIPRRQHVISIRLERIGEFSDPPDYDDWFWARQKSYAALGIAVSDIAKSLRTHTGLKEDALPPGEDSQEQVLVKQLAKLHQARDEQERQHAEHAAAIAHLVPPAPT